MLEGLKQSVQELEGQREEFRKYRRTLIHFIDTPENQRWLQSHFNDWYWPYNKKAVRGREITFQAGRIPASRSRDGGNYILQAFLRNSL